MVLCKFSDTGPFTIINFCECLFQAADLRDDMYLDALNSLLISGEYPPLFSTDELDSLLQVKYYTAVVLGRSH